MASQSRKGDIVFQAIQRPAMQPCSQQHLKHFPDIDIMIQYVQSNGTHVNQPVPLLPAKLKYAWTSGGVKLVSASISSIMSTHSSSMLHSSLVMLRHLCTVSSGDTASM